MVGKTRGARETAQKCGGNQNLSSRIVRRNSSQFELVNSSLPRFVRMTSRLNSTDNLHRLPALRAAEVLYDEKEDQGRES